MKTVEFSGGRLEELRTRRRLTQHDLASRLRARGFGTTQTTVSRWESGQRPQAAVLPALAEELGCDIGDFYDGGASADADDEADEDAMAALMRAVRAVVREEIGRTRAGA